MHIDEIRFDIMVKSAQRDGTILKLEKKIKGNRVNL